MSFPGFTAEVSLYSTQRHYYMAAHAQQRSDAISPAMLRSLVQPAACQPCYGECQDACIESSSCFEMVGGGRGACLRSCARSCSKACGCNFFR
jgi:hypothetical protein